MSNIDSDPWFGRGQTLGVTANTDGPQIVGTEKWFLDVNPITGVVNSNAPVKCIAYRNASGSPITPGTVVKARTTALLSEVDGNAQVDDMLIGVADEYLPTGGAANNDIFWVVVQGPTTANSTGTLAQGALLSVGTTAGSSAGTLTTHVANKTVGIALSAAANSKVRALVNIGERSPRHGSP